MEESKIANDKIWLFLEQKWKPQIPEYFKNVLKVCGYNNGITIAGIGDEDIEYMEQEVRNGNVTKYFVDIPEEKVLEDCTKSAEDFTFTLGHRKCLIAIVNFLKAYIDENGHHSFNVGEEVDKAPPKKSVAKKKMSSTSTSRKLCSRKRKFSEAANLTDSIVFEKASIILCGSDVDSDIEDVDEHIRILMKKTLESTITSLKKPPFKTEMFDENVESVKTKIISGSVKITKAKQKETSEEEKTSKLEAAVCCFLCSKSINAFHNPTETNNFKWNTSNFDRHLKIKHLNESHNVEEEKEDSIRPKKVLKEPLMKAKNREVNPSTTNAVIFNKKKSDIVQDEEVAIRPIKAVLNAVTNSEISSSTTKAVTLKKNESDKVETNIVQEEYTVREKIAVKKIHLNGLDNWLDSKVGPPLVCYSDSSESEEDQESEISKSHDRFLKPKQCNVGQKLQQNPQQNFDGITKETFEIASNINANGLKYENSSISLVRCVPVLQNGYNDENIIITKNTCGFDSIFNIFACLYADNLNYRAHIDSTSSNFFKLIKKLSTSDLKQSSLKYIYKDRNILLKDLYCNWGATNILKKNNKILIDCKTGIGGLYAELCFQIEESIASAIEERACHRCRTIKGKILPFLTICNTRNLHSLQSSVEVIFSRRACVLCKTMYDIKRYYNNLLVLEVEPNNKMEQNETIALKNLTQTLHVNQKQYKLYAVIQYIDILSHYTALVRRIDNNWKSYDDIRYSEFNVDDSIEIKPFLLFYIATYHHSEFKTSFSSFLCENQIRMSRMPLIRKISKCDSLPLETLIKNNII